MQPRKRHGKARSPGRGCLKNSVGFCATDSAAKRPGYLTRHLHGSRQVTVTPQKSVLRFVPGRHRLRR